MYSRDDGRRLATAAALALLAGAAGCSMTHHERQAKAEQHWNQVRARVKLQLARQQLAHGRIDEALGYLADALNWDEHSAEGFAMLARCELERGKLGAAQRAVERSIAIEYPTAEVMSLRGEVAERQGRYEDALLAYRQARALDNAKVDYVISEAECLVAVSRPEEAMALLQSSLTDYDNDPSLYASLGEIALRTGDEHAAAQAFRTVLASGTYEPIIAEEFALLAVRFGEYGDALEVLEPLLKKNDADVPASVVLAAARSMLALNRTEAAKLTLAALLKRRPDELGGWLLLAQAGVTTGDLATTQRGLAGAARLAPGDPQVLLLEAYVALREDRLDRAERALTRLLEIDASDAFAWCMLGDTAERARDLAAARRHFRRALQIDPGCTWAMSALARLGGDVSAVDAPPASVLAQGAVEAEP